MYQPPGSQPPQPPGSQPPQYPPQPPPSGANPPPPPPGFGQPSYAPPAQAPYGYAPGMQPAKPTDSMAVWSAVLAGLSIAGFFLCCIPGIVLGAIAFFLGNASLGRIRASNGMWGGEGLAQAGRIGGGIMAILSLLGLIWFIVSAALNGGGSPSTTPTP